MSPRTSHLPRLLLLTLLALTAILGVACSRKENAAPAATAEPLPASSDTVRLPARSPDDAHLAAWVLAVQQAAIDDARLALARTQSDAVKGFATQMVSDHLEAIQQWKNLDARLQLIPVEDETSRQFAVLADSARATFEPNSGLAFDRAFMANEVALHQKALDLMDSTFLPEVHALELKAWLLAHRTMDEKHLAHAKQVLATLER